MCDKNIFYARCNHTVTIYAHCPSWRKGQDYTIFEKKRSSLSWMRVDDGLARKGAEFYMMARAADGGGSWLKHR
jgi:hypothetical protein